MKDVFDSAMFVQYWEAARAWAASQLFVRETLIELGVVLAAAVAAFALAPILRAGTDALCERHARYSILVRLWRTLGLVMWPLTWLGLQWVAISVTQALGWRDGILIVTASLLSAWVVIRVASTFVRDPVWARTIAMVAWSIAALNILGLLDATVSLLDQAAMTFGAVRISLLAIVKGVLALAVMLWIATIASNVFESRIKSSPNLTPSIQVLFAKLFKITLIVVAFLAAISSVGIDLTVLTVFGGAIGVGLGFGLQKIVANLISGVILLLDKSIKPGDVIAVADYYGRVDSLGARYVSVTTRDGVEHLIPNEDLIVNRVENWSHSQNLLRLRLPVGVHYQADVRQAMALCLEAADEAERVLKEPAPVCLLRGFGDSSVDLEIRLWINDPMDGRANVGSDVLLRVWDKFHEAGIEIPYPQRDIHVRTPALADAEALGRVLRGEPPG